MKAYDVVMESTSVGTYVRMYVCVWPTSAPLFR